MPRPLKLDDAKKQRLIQLVAEGASVAAAAREIGCSSRTVERECVRDEPFGWRLNLARDARDAAIQLRLDEEASAAEAAEVVDLLYADLGAEISNELSLLWRADPAPTHDPRTAPGVSVGGDSNGCPACGCDKTATR